MKYDVAIHYFRNGLRFHDNPSFLAACAESKTLLPLYVIDPEAPFAQTAGRRAGTVRANFVLESLQEINEKLQFMGTSQGNSRGNQKKNRLVVICGDPQMVLLELVKMSKANALFFEKEVAAPLRHVDRQIRHEIREKYGYCEIRDYDTHSLFPMEIYLSKCKEQVAPSTYGGFTKIFQSMSVAKEMDNVKVIPPPLEDHVMGAIRERYGACLDIPTLAQLGYTNVEEALSTRGKGGIDFRGGEAAGLELLDKMMQRTQWVATFEKPKTSPNSLTVDTTGLSPYIKHGCLSPRRFYHALSAVYAKAKSSDWSKPPVSLHGQLMWREYNYLMGYSTPNFDRMVGNPCARQIPWDDDPALVDAWRNSRTGYPFIDAIMTQLRETGWIHHLARHAVACFLTRGDLWQSWEKGAEVFEELLIDADWGINNFNWQWLSCTAHFYQYFRCYSPIAFGKKTDPNGDYIRKWLPQFRNMPKAFIYEPWEAPLQIQKKIGVIIGKDYPNPIVDHSIISKANMGRMKEAYDVQKLNETDAVNVRRERSNNDSGPRPKRQRK